MIKNAKVSVIIPIYNTERYLREAVDSVICQDIGFKENVQIILVNDGSPDNSEEICLEYKDRYPHNIQYIYQENGGVSKARNKALKQVMGKYVIFLDSDDILGKNVLSETYEMLEKNQELDVAAVRVKFFEAKREYHKLDYKYEGREKRIIDLLENYDCVQNSCSNTLIRTRALQGREFDERLSCSEDFKLICEILLDSNKLGVVPTATYFYRRREDNSSAINKRKEDVQWYKTGPVLCYKYLFDYSKEKYGEILPYIQWSIMYDLQWRLKSDPLHMTNTLSEEEQATYQEVIFNLLREIDDRIIINQRYLSYFFKTYCLAKKYNKSIQEIRSSLELNTDGYLMFNECPIWNICNWSGSRINLIEGTDKKLMISGYINDFIPRELYELFLISNTNIKEEIISDDNNQIEIKAFNGDIVKTEKKFTVAFAIANVTSLKLKSYFRGVHTFTPRFKFDDSAKLDGLSKESIFGNKVIKTQGKEIQVRNYSATVIILKKIKRKIRNIIRSTK